jgi:hypothetical protein
MINKIDIEDCINHVQRTGIDLVRGCVFSKNHDNHITKVDWLGATMICMNIIEDYGKAGWFTRFLNLIGKDPLWFYRFNYGFSQCRVLQVYTTDCLSGQRRYHDDNVSKEGRELARKFNLI